MDYESVAGTTQIAALIFFIILFAIVLVYVFWPGNKKRFERAARLPLEKDPDPEKDSDQDGSK